MRTPLSEQSERIIRSQLQAGRYRSETDVIDDALRRLEAAQSAPVAADPVVEADQDLQRRLVAAGLLGEIRPPITDLTPWHGRETVPVGGEPLSEMILRERR